MIKIDIKFTQDYLLLKENRKKEVRKHANKYALKNHNDNVVR